MCVNQKLGEISVVLRMNKGHEMISKTARMERHKTHVARWARESR
jgi:hypothetical protein